MSGCNEADCNYPDCDCWEIKRKNCPTRIPKLEAENEQLRLTAIEAAAELESIADDLKCCSTIGGEWDGTEENAKAEYDRLMNLAGRLQHTGAPEA